SRRDGNACSSRRPPPASCSVGGGRSRSDHHETAGGTVMLTRLAGGHVIDPANNRNAIGDIFIRDGRVVDAPAGGTIDETYDISNRIVMAGGGDNPFFIPRKKQKTGRPFFSAETSPSCFPPRAPSPPPGSCNTFETGCAYAAMGFTTVVEPAVLPHQALQAHLELADVPLIDKATLTVLGNDDFLLNLLRQHESSGAIRDYVAWTLNTSRG